MSDLSTNVNVIVGIQTLIALTFLGDFPPSDIRVLLNSIVKFISCILTFLPCIMLYPQSIFFLRWDSFEIIIYQSDFREELFSEGCLLSGLNFPSSDF